jgi:hypothetical protein
MKRIEFDIDEFDESTGVKTISIVDSPAIESDFIAFDKEEIEFVELAAHKQILAGLALIPNKDIPRTNPKGEKYLAYFSETGIEKIRNKFHKQLMNNRVNVDHKQSDYINAYMVESFIIDSDERLADVKAKGIKNPVMGSWFVAYKIEDIEVFNKALIGELNGFSVEIFIKGMFESETEKALKALEERVQKLERVEVPIMGKHKNYYERKLKLKTI